ncbi:MAG: hypothetical protein IJT02_04000 [Synergistaceae bacterium]|nr:hypothetical protein [Synergistaceae bacterium]
MFKFFASVVVILVCVSPAFSDDHESRFEAFYDSIAEAANKISWSSEYKLQDVEFVRGELFDDETVYARAWYDDYYVLVRKYTGKDWSSSKVSDFWTNSEELIFLNGIKVGSPISKVEAYFGREHVYSYSPGTYTITQFEESEGGGEFIFSVENNKITSIAFTILEHQTAKMNFLFKVYASLRVAEITGEKVNVREYPPAGKVRFQVSRSKGDRLLVEDSDNRDWYHVAGRIVNNTLKTVPYYYISKQFVRVRRLTPSERERFISQYRK